MSWFDVWVILVVACGVVYDIRVWLALAGLFATAWMLRRRPTVADKTLLPLSTL